MRSRGTPRRSPATQVHAAALTTFAPPARRRRRAGSLPHRATRFVASRTSPLPRATASRAFADPATSPAAYLAERAASRRWVRARRRRANARPPGVGALRIASSSGDVRSHPVGSSSSRCCRVTPRAWTPWPTQPPARDRLTEACRSASAHGTRVRTPTTLRSRRASSPRDHVLVDLSALRPTHRSASSPARRAPSCGLARLWASTGCRRLCRARTRSRFRRRSRRCFASGDWRLPQSRFCFAEPEPARRPSSPVPAPVRARVRSFQLITKSATIPCVAGRLCSTPCPADPSTHRSTRGPAQHALLERCARVLSPRTAYARPRDDARELLDAHAVDVILVRRAHRRDDYGRGAGMGVPTLTVSCRVARTAGGSCSRGGSATGLSYEGETRPRAVASLRPPRWRAFGPRRRMVHRSP